MEGGSGYGYSLLSIVLLSNAIAILLQSLALRLGLCTNLDLAAACRLYFSRPICWFLYVGAEVAIMAMVFHVLSSHPYIGSGRNHRKRNCPSIALWIGFEMGCLADLGGRAHPHDLLVPFKKKVL